MAGGIEPRGVFIVLTLLSCVAVITDCWRRKIYNWMTFPAMAFGVAWMSWSQGWVGLERYLAGMGVAILCFGIFMAIRWLGAGDLKLLMVFGAWGGARYCLDVALSSVVLGGMLTLLVMVFTGRLWSFLRRFYRFAQSLLIRELVVEPFQADRKFRLPFAIPLGGAAILEACGQSVETLDRLLSGGWYG